MTKTQPLFIVSMSLIAGLAGCSPAPGPMPSIEWSCGNTATEVSCDDDTCDVALPGDFTPMSLSADTQGNLSLCAYSGCWEGKASNITISDDYFTASSAALIWSGTSGDPGRVSVTIDMKTNTATLLAQNYAHPMTCKASKKL